MPHAADADVQIRAATASDADIIAGIFRRASLTNEGDRENLLAHPEMLRFDASQTVNSRVQVATVAGRVVGFTSTRHLDDESAELDDLFVEPAWMRRGVARALLSDAIAAARDQGLVRLEVSANTHATSFYEALGFVTDGTVDTAFGPTPRMHRDLREGDDSRTVGSTTNDTSDAL